MELRARLEAIGSIQGRRGKKYSSELSSVNDQGFHEDAMAEPVAEPVGLGCSYCAGGGPPAGLSNSLGSIWGLMCTSVKVTTLDSFPFCRFTWRVG